MIVLLIFFISQLTKNILAQNSNDLGLVTSYSKHATSQLVSVGDNISDTATSTSCNWNKKYVTTHDLLCYLYYTKNVHHCKNKQSVCVFVCGGGEVLCRI